MFAQNFQTLFARRMSSKQQEFVNLKIQIPALIQIQLIMNMRPQLVEQHFLWKRRHMILELSLSE